MKTWLPVLALGCLLFTPPGHAEEGAGVPVIPSAYIEGRYTGTWGSNPFLRHSAPVQPVHTSWADDWNLAGLYKSTSGEVTVTLLNQRTGGFTRIASNVPGEFKLLRAGFHRDRDQAFVEVEKDGQKALLKYGERTVASHAGRVIR